ncbi:MAG: hypothetical protein HETSPECPRED_004281 [Heterodermia speciosa]|uniref:Uncharacterized protein n=1 Tax=Heterodermia speciosa TaxID=116794 RepID=A0A8H3IH24_9LECA|nr:MAG: hypothetical protein HETSPECPRED_004281 [Heterodermia speciosa]
MAFKRKRDTSDLESHANASVLIIFAPNYRQVVLVSKPRKPLETSYAEANHALKESMFALFLEINTIRLFSDLRTELPAGKFVMAKRKRDQTENSGPVIIADNLRTVSDTLLRLWQILGETITVEKHSSQKAIKDPI